MSKTTEISMATFIDNLLLAGGTWDAIVAKAAAEAKRRNIATLSTKAEIRAHTKHRSKSPKWRVTMDDVKVKMVAVAQPAKPVAKAKPETAKAAQPKPATKPNGNGNGRPQPATGK